MGPGSTFALLPSQLSAGEGSPRPFPRVPAPARSPAPACPAPQAPPSVAPGTADPSSCRRRPAQRSSPCRHRRRSRRHRRRAPAPASAPAPTRSAMPPRRALAPGAQLLPTSALLLLLLGAGPRGCCLASPVPAAPLPAPGPCAAQPCRNGGVCTPHPAPGQQSPAPAGEPGYSCTCPDGVSGANCQVSGPGGRGAGRRPGTNSFSPPDAARCPARGSSMLDTGFSSPGEGMNLASRRAWLRTPGRPLKCLFPAHPSSPAVPAWGSGRASLQPRYSWRDHWPPSDAPLLARAKPCSVRGGSGCSPGQLGRTSSERTRRRVQCPSGPCSQSRSSLGVSGVRVVGVG